MTGTQQFSAPKTGTTSLPSRTSGAGTPHRIEPELLGTRPRRIEFTRTVLGIERTRFWLWNTCAALCVILLFLRNHTTVPRTPQELLVEHGYRTQATVVKKQAIQTRQGKMDVLLYRYDVHGIPILGRKAVYGTNRKEGDTLPVTYLPEQPTCHYFGPIVPESVARPSSPWLTAFIWVGGIGIVLIVATERRLAEAGHLLRQGTPVPALILRSPGGRNPEQTSNDLV